MAPPSNGCTRQCSNDQSACSLARAKATPSYWGVHCRSRTELAEGIRPRSVSSHLQPIRFGSSWSVLTSAFHAVPCASLPIVPETQTAVICPSIEGSCRCSMRTYHVSCEWAFPGAPYTHILIAVPRAAPPCNGGLVLPCNHQCPNGMAYITRFPCSTTVRPSSSSVAARIVASRWQGPRVSPPRCRSVPKARLTHP